MGECMSGFVGAEAASASRTGGVLGLFAHPDDEQFGTAGALHRCALRGIPVTILSATSGDAGEISDPSLATPETLAEVREEELRTACRALGFQEPLLLRHRDGKLGEVDQERLVDELVKEIRRLQPSVVLTFDANGGYGHPDHVVIHRAAIEALARAADPAHRDDLGPAHDVPKVYCTAYPRSRLSKLNDLFVEHGVPPIDFGSVKTIEDDQMGTADQRITTAVEVEAWWDARWAGLTAHRTQYGANNPFIRLPVSVMRAFMTTDFFRRVKPTPGPDARLPDEDDLWSGLPLPDGGIHR